MTDERLETVLKAVLRLDAEVPLITGTAAERILARLMPLPRQKAPLWRIPNVLLGWDFAPAWSRVAALAGCAMLGFIVGMAGLDRRFDNLDAPFVVASNADMDAALFGSEPFVHSWP